MKRALGWLIFPLALAAAAVLAFGMLREDASAPSGEVFTVETAPFESWIPLSGTLEPSNPTSLRAELDGLSKLIWLIGDGTPVEAGDEVARFDPSDLEGRKIGMIRDLRLAEAERTALVEARHPLELERLERELRTAQSEWRRESELVEDTKELLDAELIPQGEMARQRERVTELESTVASLKRQIALTRDTLHPALKEQADAKVEAARAALERVDERLERTRVKAPIRGTVHLPRVPIDGERRPVRVGDGLYKNQVFMEMADLTRLLVKSAIGERDLPRIQPGREAVYQLPALPDRDFHGQVVSVGARPGGSDREYSVELSLDDPVNTLRPGLSVEIEVLAERLEEAVVIPRAAVAFSADGVPVTELRGTDGTWERRELVPGPGDATSLVVRQGLVGGERVRRP